MLAITDLVQIAEVGGFLVGGDFGEGLLAGLGHVFIVVAAMNAGPQFGTARRAGVPPRWWA
jgi:hypothetical protein